MRRAWLKELHLYSSHERSREEPVCETDCGWIILPNSLAFDEKGAFALPATISRLTYI
jgi:hypothetical protein